MEMIASGSKVVWAPGKGELMQKILPGVGEGPFEVSSHGIIWCTCGAAKRKSGQHLPQCAIMTSQAGIESVKVLVIDTPEGKLRCTPDLFVLAP